MFTPRSSQILLLTALAVTLGTLPVVGQMDWKKLSPGPSPSARVFHAMAYDSARQRVVLFGGRDSNWKFLNDTWEWDGTSWTQRIPTTNIPSARCGHAMVYNKSRKRIVLFGGIAGVPPALNDTWEWDGNNWAKCNPTTIPSQRAGHAMAYDNARQRIVLFGGGSGPPSNQFLNDTWEWIGNNWAKCNPPTKSPRPRSCHGMAYDAVHQRVVLFGGGYGLGVPIDLNDTWEWDGNSWIQSFPLTSPNARSPNDAMANDVARQKVVLFGGGGLNVFNDTWEWDGNNWKQRKPTTNPAARANHALAYDATRGNMVLFGGVNNMYYPDTWAYAPTDLIASTHFISVATGGTVTLSLNAGTAHVGKSYLVLGCIDGTGPRGITSGNVTLLLNRDGYFMFTLMYPNNNALHVKTLGTLDTSGTAIAGILVPKGLPASLIGLRFYHAYVVFGSSIDYASTPVPMTLR